MAEELAAFASKDEMLAKSKQFWNPDKTQFWIDSGVPLVIGRREGYLIWDVAGALVRTAPAGLAKVIYGSGGGEAIDIALKSARHATGKRRIVSVAKAYHGHTGLAVATGDERFASLFLSDRPDEFSHVPFNDLDAMEQALRGRDVAAVIMETIPATYGFPLPAPGHREGARFVMRRLYENGVWAIFATLDPAVLQYKPGILLTPALAEELLERTASAIGAAREDAAGSRP